MYNDDYYYGVDVYRKPERKGFYVAFLIIFALIYLAVTAYLAVGYVDALNSDGEINEMPIFLAFGVIIVGIIGYGISEFFALVGLIVACIKRASSPIRPLFIIALILPIVTEGIFILLCKLA